MTTPVVAIHAMFFLSGAGALAFETIWFAQAGLVVGNSVWSAALVVAAFMAGLALGNALAARLARRATNLVLAYAAVEAIAAVSGALLVIAFPHLPALFRPVLAPLLGEPAALSVARLAIAFVLMVIPATALGATLPLLARPLESLTGSYGFALGRLYGVNTLGAVAGTLAAELLLIPGLGLRGSGLVAAACNLGAAGIAILICKRMTASSAKSAPVPDSGRWRSLVAAFLAGAVLLALEVIGFRFILLYIDGTTTVFAFMLAVVLAGIALGGLAAARLARQGRLSADLARAAASAAAVAVVGGYAVVPWLPKTSVVLLCAVAIGPAAFFSGALFTALGAQLREAMDDAGAATAALTAANTVGAMAGSLAAAFLLLPLLGMEISLFCLAGAYVAIAFLIPGGRWLEPALAAPVVAALVAVGAGSMRSEHYRAIEARHDARLLEAREGVEQTAFYLQHEFLGEPIFLRLGTNSYSMASTVASGHRYMKLFAWLPAALHPRLENVLLICFGVGSTASAIAALPEVKRFDVVDTSRDILAMSRHALPARHPLDDPRAQVHIEDGRFFLQMTARRYDLITGEPPPPTIAGVAPLYTREHFELVKDRLNPGGIATWWLPGHLLLQADVLAIIGAFCEAFEDCSLWSGFNRDWILLGSKGGVAPVPREHFSRLWRLEGTREDLQRFAVESPAAMAALFMADARALRELAGKTPPLIDDFPRRIRPELKAEPMQTYAQLMDAEAGRRHLERSAWAQILPPDLLRDEGAFRRRPMIDRALNAALRDARYSYWGDIAWLVRETKLVELPRWLLGSGAAAVAIAERKDPALPLAAEHRAINAVATRERPREVNEETFKAMTPWGQLVTVFHHCLAGEAARAHALIASMRARDLGPNDAFMAWAANDCPRP